MNVPCPNCKSVWIIKEDSFAGGTLRKCGQCSKDFRVPLYCPTCNPVGKEDKTFLDAAGIKGGDPIRCPSGHVFTVPVTSRDANERLTSLAEEGGRGGVVCQYHQGTRSDSLPYEKLKQAVSGGYCAGVVLDWIRRSVLGGKLTYENAEGETSGAKFDKMMQQTTKGALAQTQVKLEKRNAFKDRVDAWVQRESEQYKSHTESLWDTYQQVVEALPKRGTPELIAEVNRKMREAEQLYLQEHEAATTAYQAKIAPADKPRMQLFWKSFAVTMDGCLDALRRTQGKDGPAKGARYSGLTVAAAINQKEFAGGVHQIAAELLANPHFKTCRAASVSVVPPRDKAIGHAVGIVRQNTGDVYEMFDPNLGVYRFSPASKLSEAFDYIFKTAYPNWLGGGTTDDQRYEIGGKVNGSYTIFDCAGPSSEGVAPDVPLKQVTTEPKQATAQ